MGRKDWLSIDKMEVVKWREGGHTMKGEGVVDVKMSEEEEERAYRMNWIFPSMRD